MKMAVNPLADHRVLFKVDPGLGTLTAVFKSIAHFPKSIEQAGVRELPWVESRHLPGSKKGNNINK